MPNRTHTGGFPAQRWIERMVVDLEPGATALDLGCGGGEPIARFLHDRGFAITGVDLADSQIVLARARFPTERWIKADMLSVVLEQAAFDCVIAWSSLTWLSRTEQAMMAMRAAAWLKPGGQLLFNAEPDHDTTRNDYRNGSPYRADLEAANYSAGLARSGLIEVAHEANEAASGGGGVWLARKP